MCMPNVHSIQWVKQPEQIWHILLKAPDHGVRILYIEGHTFSYGASLVASQPALEIRILCIHFTIK